jgi:hypothetical protein
MPGVFRQKTFLRMVATSTAETQTTSMTYEHMSPEELVEGILQKERRIVELMGEINSMLMRRRLDRKRQRHVCRSRAGFGC